MEAVAKRNILIRQEDIEGGKKRDVKSVKGEKIKLTDQEAIKFWGALDLSDKDKTRLIGVAKANGYKRLI